MDVNNLLAEAVLKNASDLHLAAGQPPRMRIDGDLVVVDNQPVITELAMEDMLEQILTSDKRKDFESSWEADLSYALKSGDRFRVNIFKQTNGLSIVFRVIPAAIHTMEELGLPEIIRNLCDLPKGLVLITGPTGCGKSTTLASMIDYINRTKKLHILTFEDPVEYSHTSQSCLVQQREVGQHTKSFAKALRAALREDPDVILVGEMRDLETIRLALTAAETGHLVFATLHTSSAAKTINRIVDVFPAGEKDMVRSMLSESLQAVVAQVLVKKVGGGRVAAHEIMVCNPAIRNLIREDKLPQIVSALETGGAQGMTTLNASLQQLLNAGLIDQQTYSERTLS
jgi:twitching motility protein PilT